jgi:hypothetical protein
MICVLEMRCRMNGGNGAKRRWAHAYNVSFQDGTLKRTGDEGGSPIEKHPFATDRPFPIASRKNLSLRCPEFMLLSP